MINRQRQQEWLATPFGCLWWPSS